MNNFGNYNVNINILDENNIQSYLPNTPIDLRKENRFTDRQLLDLIGGLLLSKYGGLWISPGSVTLPVDYTDILSHVKTTDVVSFGSNNAYSCDKTVPNNYIIGSRGNCAAMNRYINKLIDQNLGKIDVLHNHMSTKFNALGESIIETSATNKHFCCQSDGSHDINNKKITIGELVGDFPIHLDYSKTKFITYPYDMLNLERKYSWFENMTMDDLLSSNINIVNEVKKGL